MGGTHQPGDWSTEARETDRQFIWEGCKALKPSSIQGAEFIKDWVGLRPSRNGVRIEKDQVEYHGKQYDVCLYNSLCPEKGTFTD